MESKLPAFKESNPQLEVETKLIRGQHPHLEGIYSKNNSVTYTHALCNVDLRSVDVNKHHI